MSETSLPYTELLAQLQFHRHPMLVPSQRDDKVNEITTSEYQTGNYRVFVTNSAYVSDIVVTLNNFYIHLTFLDKNTVVLGLRHRVEESPGDLREVISDKLLSSIRQAMATGIDLGRFPLHRGRRYTAWNFHSNLIYAQG